MGKVSEMDATIRELRDIAASIDDIANWLAMTFTGEPEEAEEPGPDASAAPAAGGTGPAADAAPALEEVRAILAEKSREGFTAQLRELLQKYGASRLSEVDPAHYEALIADVEGLSKW